MSIRVCFRNIPTNHTLNYEVTYSTLEEAVCKAFANWRTKVIWIISEVDGSVHYGVHNTKTGELVHSYMSEYALGLEHIRGEYTLLQSEAFLYAKQNPTKVRMSEMVYVNKGLLLALLQTAKTNTDLEAIYDDIRGSSYPWSEIPSLTSVNESELLGYINK